jgi:hypothetical protein
MVEWQLAPVHMQRQFHLPFLPLVLPLTPAAVVQKLLCLACLCFCPPYLPGGVVLCGRRTVSLCSSGWLSGRRPTLHLTLAAVLVRPSRPSCAGLRGPRMVCMCWEACCAAGDIRVMVWHAVLCCAGSSADHTFG